MPARARQRAAHRTALRTVHYPEWDRLIGRLRPHWCTVIETVAPAASASALRVDLERRLARTVRLLRGAAVSDRRPTRGRSEHGDLLHTGALIDAGIALRSRRDPGRRLHRDSAARVEPVEVLLLVDTSASTALGLEPGRRVLDALRDARRGWPPRRLKAPDIAARFRALHRTRAIGYACSG
jgi:nitric oxide reductase NorD protein